MQITNYFSPSKKVGKKSKHSRPISHSKCTPNKTTTTIASIFVTQKQQHSSAPQVVVPVDKVEPGQNHETGLLLQKLPLPSQTLLSHLTEKSWLEALLQPKRRFTSSAKFSSLAKFVEVERAKQTVYPTPADTFSALNLLPLNKVRVVIIGQDPYHQPGQGHGLAFSVRKGVVIPPSLRNIYKEIENDPDVDFSSTVKDTTRARPIPTHGFLERWVQQGVLLLNSALTVRRSEANSHAKKGWEDFTDEIIRILVDRKNIGGAFDSSGNSEGDDKEAGGLVFLLWGKPASKKAESILGGTNMRNGNERKRHVVICTSHPSPLGATKTDSPFLGSRCFSRANEALKNMGHEMIDWNVDGSCFDNKESETDVTNDVEYEDV